MSTPETIDAEAEEIPSDLDLVQPAQPATLFRTDDPVKVLERATRTADALRDVITKQRLYVPVSGKNHITIEGWQTLGAMLGVTSLVEWTRPVEDGWEARVVVNTMDGRTIGAAEAQCLTSEGKPWKTAKDHAVRSMAQTRASSKALASVLRFVAVLGGYAGTPAEDAPETAAAATGQAPKEEAAVEPLDEETTKEIGELIAKTKIGFTDLTNLFGSIGGEAPKINRGDSIYKAVRALNPEQAEKMLGSLDAKLA